ncbi:FxsA family protein [Marinomonas ostreistagni]|uniref:FxsA family protein n=1 Tax=Marinomonas ostreistagni TaxID=359209 RepID=UPI001950750B|nr:FxsA family protein [Marinomonas ostreistagni]MBM6550111.1 FxsA family protein [Marinomonas ostreistagni]
MRFALLLFILIPIVELTVLIQVGAQIGSLTTIALVFLTAIIGLALIRRQGFATHLKAQEKIRRGEMPASEVAQGFMLAVAGLCLLIPGFVTDAMGALLLITPLRKAIATTLALDFLKKRMNMRAAWSQQNPRGQAQSHHIIEGEYRPAQDDKDEIDKK